MVVTGAQKGIVVPPEGGQAVHIPGFGAICKLYSRDNGGEVAIVEHPFAVGMITAPHRHTREDEHSIALQGQIGFRSDDDEVVPRPGGYITKPRGQTHAMWNADPVPGPLTKMRNPARPRRSRCPGLIRDRRDWYYRDHAHHQTGGS